MYMSCGYLSFNFYSTKDVLKNTFSMLTKLNDNGDWFAKLEVVNSLFIEKYPVEIGAGTTQQSSTPMYMYDISMTWSWW